MLHHIVFVVHVSVVVHSSFAYWFEKLYINKNAGMVNSSSSLTFYKCTLKITVLSWADYSLMAASRSIRPMLGILVVPK